MKLVSYLKGTNAQLGLYLNGNIYDLHALNADIPPSMGAFLFAGEEAMDAARAVEAAIINGSLQAEPDDVPEDFILAPVPFPTSCRDGYAFRQHVEAARRNRGVDMIPQFDEYPIFYFTNHNAVQGPGEIACMPDHFLNLDFELEAAIVIGKQGRNVPAEEADSYIAGFMIMNDMSARTLQMEEMLLNLGPAKGKDFSTVIGPWLVTPDELEPFRVPAKPGHVGANYNLGMKCWVNGKLVSEGNVGDMDWTFAEIIERCSYGVDILPGDVIGSGTVGTGCFLELNGTGKRLDPENFKPQWLQEGDEVKMEITALGTLVNTIVREDSNFSIMARKKVQR